MTKEKINNRKMITNLTVEFFIDSLVAINIAYTVIKKALKSDSFVAMNQILLVLTPFLMRSLRNLLKDHPVTIIDFGEKKLLKIFQGCTVN